MRLTIDFETRSYGDIQALGQIGYAAHPTTEILCLAAKVDDLRPNVWIPHWAPIPTEITTEEVDRLVRQADEIEAHNAGFEMAIWSYCWPGHEKLPIAKIRCSAAKAAMHGLPRALGQAITALDLPHRKDAEGHFLMKKMCSPHKDGRYLQDAESYRRLIEYCRQDVEAEYHLSQVLRDLPPIERQIWQIDHEINARGITIDMDLVFAAIKLDEAHRKDLLEEFCDITDGEVGTPACLQKFLGWLKARDIWPLDLTKASVIDLLAQPDLPRNVKRALEIRQSWGKTSVAKYSALLARVVEGKAKDLLLYHAATTGRWGGQKFQPQNLPSRGILKDTESSIAAIKAGAPPDEIDMLYGDPQWVLSSCIRGCVIAPPGKDLLVADYSAIEARVLAWVAGEEWVLQAYRENQDLYVRSAAGIYRKPEAEITKDERQIGKVAILACGYAGGKGAFARMAEAYGITIAESRAQEIVSAWRESRPLTVRFWKDVERAAMSAVENPGDIFTVGRVMFRCDGIWLRCRLPAGRDLYYPFPQIGTRVAPWGDEVPTLTFMGVDLANKWTRMDTHGGKLTENIVQGIARDVLATALVNLRNSIYQVVLHVHDENISEVDEGKGSVEEYCRIMVDMPPWAEGLPLAAEGWRGKRYRK